jgi:hypothetical protein
VDDLGLGQRVQVGEDLGPRAVAAEHGDALLQLGLEDEGEEGAEDVPRMVASTLWKIGRVASRCSAVRKAASTVQSCIVGADRVSRTALLLQDETLRAGLSLWTLFVRYADLFRRRARSDVAACLMLHGSNEGWSALVTPPENALGPLRNTMDFAVHTRPRLNVMSALKKLAPAPLARGGLSPVLCVVYASMSKRT